MIENELSLQVSEIVDINGFESFAMLCVTQGKLTVTVGNCVYQLSSDTAVFFAPDEFYYIESSENAEYIFVPFNATGEILQKLSGLAVQIGEQEMLLPKTIDRLINYADNSVSNQQIFSMLELFILLCCQKKSIDICEDKNALLFSKAADILKRNVDSNISLSDLADKLNISLSNLKRLFAQYANIGVHEYYTFLKIARAKELLRQGETVTATSKLTGFANQAYFSAAFKRVVGITPKDYASNKKSSVHSAKQPKKNKEKELPSYLL